MNELRQYVILKSLVYPIIADEISDLYQQCIDEIEDGESPANEIAICYTAIDDLIAENEAIINNAIDNIYDNTHIKF